MRELLRQWPLRGAIVLWMTSGNYGHYVSVFEQDVGADGQARSIQVFDPYGDVEPDGWGEKMEPSLKRSLRQDAPWLLRAIDSAGYSRVFYNEYPLQRRAPEICTCGRWSLLRLANAALSVEKFATEVLDACERRRVSPDVLVVLMTQPLLAERA